MSMLKVVETWEARLPAEPEREIPTKSGGMMKFPALKERTVLMALLEAMDGSGCRAQVELPEGTPALDKDAVIQLEVPDFPDTPLRSRRLTRVIPPSKSAKGAQP